jgi:hypothetical protein
VNGKEVPTFTSARHAVIDDITSCVTPNGQHAPGNDMKRLQERELAEAFRDPLVPACHASNSGISGL